ncbi:hypothetical protein FDECE_15433 [Fusarium decemcellulare]|nr:hypothetical protein FDECE_15433 [Fusarium decemcellulare]
MRFRRKPQRWFFLVPLLEQKLQLPEIENFHFRNDSPKAFCIFNLSIDAFDRLYSPLSTGHSTERLAAFLKITPPRNFSRLSSLEKLPLELLNIVFDLLDQRDLVALGLCSQKLWIDSVSTMLKNRIPWAGTPMILTGTRLWALPYAIYNVCPGAREVPCSSSNGRRSRNEGRTQPQRWNERVIRDYDEPDQPGLNSYRQNLMELVSLSGIPEDLHPHMLSCLTEHGASSGSKWYLRNHTAGEYIRMEFAGGQSSNKDSTITLVGHRWLTLDILLMWLVSWNCRSEPSKTCPARWEEYKEIGVKFEDMVLEDGDLSSEVLSAIIQVFRRIGAGKWAGHSLDVVDERFEELTEGWFDRTSTIQKNSRDWLVAIYGEALRKPSCSNYREYWAEFAKAEAV